jgi:hypothetical protein
MKHLIAAMSSLKIPYGFTPPVLVPLTLESPVSEIPSSQLPNPNANQNNSNNNTLKRSGSPPPSSPDSDTTVVQKGNNTGITVTTPTAALKTAVLETASSFIKGGAEAAERAATEYEKSVQPPENLEKSIETVRGAGLDYSDDEKVDKEVVSAIMTLWKDSGIQYCFSRSNEFHLLDNCD